MQTSCFNKVPDYRSVFHTNTHHSAQMGIITEKACPNTRSSQVYQLWNELDSNTPSFTTCWLLFRRSYFVYLYHYIYFGHLL